LGSGDGAEDAVDALDMEGIEVIVSNDELARKLQNEYLNNSFRSHSGQGNLLPCFAESCRTAWGDYAPR
jgi:hypothetical protein